MSKSQITVIGDDKVIKMLNTLSVKAKKPFTAMKIVANAMYRDVIKNFDNETGPKGRWVDLKEKTWKEKAKKGKTKMLVNTGNLRRRNYQENGNDWAAVSNDVSYAKDQNYGNKKLPAREFLWISKKGLKNILALMKAYVSEGL